MTHIDCFTCHFQPRMDNQAEMNANILFQSSNIRINTCMISLSCLEIKFPENRYKAVKHHFYKGWE